jgi:hypothetical protein
MRRDYSECARVELELLPTKRKEEYKKSGLNWGQRGKRNPNQGYLRVPAKVGRGNFFPPTGQTFRLETEEGMAFSCKVSQQSRKAIHSSPDTSVLGEYFRARLDVPDGDMVTPEHLEEYGRSSVSIYKRGEYDYVLGFASTREK